MQDDFTLESYDYKLPEESIAQHPSEQRDTSKLFILNRKSQETSHGLFADIVDYFNKGDILVINDTKVFPARLFGKKTTGGKAEVFLLEFPTNRDKRHSGTLTRLATATALVKSSKRPKVGSAIVFSDILQCKILKQLDNGQMQIELEYSAQFDIMEILSQFGTIPLPPYIERTSGTSEEDRERYQTVYASNNGAVAAPTAGLHFTSSLFAKLQEKGVELATLTLHVGYGTFAPVRTSAIKDHKIHKEFITLAKKTAAQINRVKENGGKVWAVGTTTVRALEFSCDPSGKLQPTEGWCDLYIFPGYRFSIIDNLITNFHLPQSSLLFLVSALCGRTTLMKCYKKAIAKDYRFYSYGDAMAILSDEP